jgi:hypothetical protein
LLISGLIPAFVYIYMGVLSLRDGVKEFTEILIPTLAITITTSAIRHLILLARVTTEVRS